MLAIRLSRIGHENLQKFRLIVQEKTCSPKSGKVVAIVGNYDPTDPDNKLVFDAEQVEAFLKNGAEPSDTVARLLLKNGFKKELVEKFVVKYTKQKPKKSEEGKPAEGEEAQASGEGEAPAAEGDAAPAESTDQAAEAEQKEDKPKPKADEQPASEEGKKEESSDKTPEEKPDEKPADEDKADAEEKK